MMGAKIRSFTRCPTISHWRTWSRKTTSTADAAAAVPTPPRRPSLGGGQAAPVEESEGVFGGLVDVGGAAKSIWSAVVPAPPPSCWYPISVAPPTYGVCRALTNLRRRCFPRSPISPESVPMIVRERCWGGC